MFKLHFFRIVKTQKLNLQHVRKEMYCINCLVNFQYGD